MDNIDVYAQTKIKFCRFLYLSQTVPKYWAGKCTPDMKFPERDMFQSLIGNETNAETTLSILEVANKDETLRIPVIYATAVLLTILPPSDQFKAARQRLYGLIPFILKDSNELFLFSKYVTDLGLKKGGRWQKCMLKWYAVNGAGLILKDLCIIRSRYGWSHKDICNLIHMPNQSTAMPFLMYIYRGIDGVLQSPTIMENYKNNEMERIQTIDGLKKCHNMKAATETIKKNAFIKFVNVPTRFLMNFKESLQMWVILINRMTVDELLENVLFLQKVRKLNEKKTKAGKKQKRTDRNAQLIKEIEKALKTTTAPAFKAFIAFSNFEKFNGLVRKKKFWAGPKLNKKNPKGHLKAVEKKARRPVKSKRKLKLTPHPKLLNELKIMTNRSLSSVNEACNVRCLLVLDMSIYMRLHRRTIKKPNALKKGDPNVQGTKETEKTIIVRKYKKCFYNKNVIVRWAEVFMALFFTKYFKETTVAVYTKEGISSVDLYNKSDPKSVFPTMEEAEKKLLKFENGPAMLNKPFEWAVENNKEFDLIINVVETPSLIKKYKTPLRNIGRDVHSALDTYKQKMNLPDAKAVTVTLCTQKAVTASETSQDVLDISGFDENLPSILANFTNKKF